MKTNNNVVAGELKSLDYSSYVDYLNSYIQYMEDNDAPLSAISVQMSPILKLLMNHVTGIQPNYLNFVKIMPNLLMLL